MEIGENSKLGSDSQDSDDVQVKNKSSLQPTSLGVQNAKKRLRAFSIQKKTSLSPVSIPKPVSSGSATVFIGKLASAKPVSKLVEDPEKKVPKPPKPGASRQYQDSYIHLRKNTLCEIEDMKRKMELVELGIPLGLICPAPNSDKAMPTKAMPPIKSFLARKIRIIHPVKAIKKPPPRKVKTKENPAKVDEIIREAKKAKAEGKEFKFNYNKLLPDYDNPFQRKKDESDKTHEDKQRAQTPGRDKHPKGSDKYNPKRRFNRKTDNKDSYRDRRKPKEREARSRDIDDRSKEREVKSKDREDKSKERDDKKIEKYEASKPKKEEPRNEEPRNEEPKSDRKETKSDLKKAIKCEAYKDSAGKETDVDLKDYLVCDSWSLDNEDNKSKEASPKSLPREEGKEKTPPKFIDPMEQLRHSLTKKKAVESPVNKPKIEKLKPVIDSFKFEIEDDDDLLDMFDENTSLDKFAKPVKSEAYTSPLYENESKDVSMDGSAEDTFLESVINEIKAEEMDESSPDKGLVEYESPNRESVTPELDSSRSSRRSDYSDGFKSIESYKSIESGYKSTESGYKSTDSGYTLTEAYRQEEAYKLAESYRSPERSYKCPEMPYKNTSESYSTPERPYRSSERSYNSPQRSYKSDRSYGSPDRRYVSSERSYSSMERSYRSSERSYNSPERYKSQERSYDSPESQYKSLDRNYKSTDPRYKPNERSYSSPDIAYKQTDKNYKYTETGYKSPESAYNYPDRSYKLPERIYRSPEVAYQNKNYKSDKGYDRSPQMAYKSVDRGYKSPEVTYKSSDRGYKSPEVAYTSSERDYKVSEASYKSTERRNKSDRYESKSPDYQRKSSKQEEENSRNVTRSMMDSLETWDFVLKVCQPLLFRHDRNRCYKETRISPKLWFNENPKLCDCIKDRTTVYDELEMTKMELVDTVYACDQVPEASFPTARGWYPPASQCLVEHSKVQLSSEWEADDSQLECSATPQKTEMDLDKEYHRFMKSVWPEVESKSETPRSTPVRESKKPDVEEKRKKSKLSSEGWSQESDVDDDGEKSKKTKIEKEKRKRKRSSSTVSEVEVDAKKRKKILKKRDAKKSKEKSSKRLSKKVLKKLKEKHKKKKKAIKREESDEDTYKREKKRKDKKAKKKKLQKQKKKNLKKKKSRKRSTSTSSASESTTDSELDKKYQKKKNRKQNTTESTQEDLFDVNILNNIKTERLTDDENIVRTKPREIIDVKELQNDFVGNSIQIKKEVEEVKEVELKKEEESVEVPEVPEVPKVAELPEVAEVPKVAEVPEVAEVLEDKSESQDSQTSETVKEIELADIKIPDDPPPTPQLKLPEESTSQSSSSSIQSNKEAVYEKDESHLRPSSQNSNYSFQDVMQSQGGYQKEELEDQHENYEGNYEMYEQMAMEYQSDVASQRTSPPCMFASQRIETVVRVRSCGEIKCDWRPGDRAPAHTPQRPSRWGLKPSEVNIVLTGGSEQFPIQNVVEPVYKIQSIANRTDNSTTGYDEAYQDMYAASDKLQYGDCFNSEREERQPEKNRTSTLDDRIDLALRTTVLGEVAKDAQEEDKNKENGILATKPGPAAEPRSVKRVSFADGYKPGQDSDVEEPPIKKKKKVRRFGCAWPCPATHPDHVPLWDALPPPPPPPGSPPPAAPAPAVWLQAPPPHHMPKFDPNMPFMPPEPPPGVINF